MKLKTVRRCVIAIFKPKEETAREISKNGTWPSLVTFFAETYPNDFSCPPKKGHRELERAIHKYLSLDEFNRICFHKTQAKKKKDSSWKYRTERGFYSTPEWQKLRYRVLKKHGARCEICGRTFKEDGVKMHVDHIKPRSKSPELELEETNLQVLCEDCNLGKLARDEIDWR